MKKKPSVYDFLAEIKRRPEMYVGGSSSMRMGQLHGIELLLCGYGHALRLHNIDEAGKDFTREFAAYLHRKYQWSASCGPVAAIRDAVKSDDEAWDLFWRLVEEFRLASPT